MPEREMPHSYAFSVVSSMDGTVGILALAGAVGVDEEERIVAAYKSVTASGAKTIRLRFLPGTTINSAGIAVLITMTSDVRRSKQKVEVAGLSPHYRKIFEMIGLMEYVRHVDEK